MKKGVTINGKALELIEMELRAPLPEEELKETEGGVDYIPVESYERRLNEVIGVPRYNRKTSATRFEEVAGCYVAVNTTFLEIYDDDGNVCLQKSAPGGSNVVIIEKTQKPRSLKSEVSSAASEGFKNCCKQLNIGIDQVRRMRDEKKESGRKGTNIQNGANANRTKSRGDENVNLHKMKFLTRLSSGNKNYSANVVDLSTGEELQFKIFEKDYPQIEKIVPFSDFITKCAVGTELSFYGYYNVFRGTRQIIFVEPYVKEGS